MKEDVKRVLRLEQPLKGTEIARRIGHDRGAVNSFLDIETFSHRTQRSNGPWP